MACNCKKKMVLEDTYGTKEDETLIWKLNRYIWRIVMFILLIVMSLVLVPILVFSIIFQMVFRKSINITVPKFLGKFMKSNG